VEPTLIVPEDGLSGVEEWFNVPPEISYTKLQLLVEFCRVTLKITLVVPAL
jgi:hypothetical protein